MKLYNYNASRNYSGKRIRIARETLRLSQERLAAKMQLAGLEINQQAISRIETGARVIPDYELPFFADALNVNILWLLEMED